MVLQNKILIANLNKSFFRFQTIAHECRHSVQNKKLQLLHFILANLYNLGYYPIMIAVLLSKNTLLPLFATFMIVVGMSFLMLKYFLEKDAITNSKDIAIDYLKKQNLNDDDIQKIEAVYGKINEQGINFLKFNNILNFNVKTIFYLIILLII